MNKVDNQRELELYAIQVTLSTENGRAFMYRCLQQTGVYNDIFDIDPIKSAYNSGLRTHGLWLDAELREASFDNYTKMMKENRDG